MSKTALVLLASVLVAAAANPFQPVRRGRAAPGTKPDQSRVAFWDTPKFDPGTEAPPLPAELTITGFGDDGDGYYLVQFQGPAPRHQFEEIEAEGARFIGLHSRHLGFIHGNRDAANRVAQLGFVRWVGPYQPGYKFWSGTLDAAGSGRVVVILFRDADLDRAAAELATLGCEPVRSAQSESFKVVEVDCRQELVASIARLSYVMSIEEWHEPQIENENCQWVVQDWAQDERRVWDQGVLGDDEVLGYTDTGLDVNHWAFQDPGMAISDTGEFPTHRKVVVFKHYPPAGGVGDPNGHGTHVAGTIAGSDSAMGGTNANDGHSRNARIVHLSPIPQPPGNDFTAPLDMIANDLRNPELRPHTISNSWWTGTRGQYTTAAASFDNFAWNNRDIVLIKSCGNQGQSSRYLITEPGNSKSIVSAASLQNGTSSTVLSSFSSRGPAPDDRIKPDIAVPGEGIYSAQRNSTNGYVSMSGTSMAAPATNGSIGLLRSYLRKGYYPSGQANAADTFGYVSAALLKAMLLVSADPNVGSYVVPSEYIGWGRVNLDSVMFFNDSAADERKLLLDDDTTGLATGEYAEYAFQVTDTMPLRVAVVWTDTAAAAGANPALINDIDALLTGPGGDYYKGNLYSSGHSEPNPPGSHDALNPLEMFRVHGPQPGAWTLRVTGAAVPGSATQPFAVVITGAVRAGSDHDVGVNALLAPTGVVDSAAVVTPACSVYNYGQSVEDYQVRMRIGTMYDTVVAVSSHDPDETRYVIFPDWTAHETGCLGVTCSTELAIDQNPGNDAETGAVGVGRIDVGATAILSPAAYVDSGTVVTPEARVANFGPVSATFPVWFRIHASSDGFADRPRSAALQPWKAALDQIYEDSIWLTLAVGDTADVTFDDWTASPLDTFRLEAFTAHDCDVNPLNDTVTGSLAVVRPFHDVGVLEILAPKDTVDTGAVVVPVAVVGNFGSFSESFLVHFHISPDWHDSVSVNLAPRATDTVEFAPWDAGQLGLRLTRCTTALAGDIDPTNDQVSGSVIVFPRTGIGEGPGLPVALVLGEGRPTPFRRSVSIRYGLPNPGRVELAVYSTSGALVRRLAAAELPAGYHEARWDGRDEAGRVVARGVYYCRLETPGDRQLRKLVRLD